MKHLPTLTLLALLASAATANAAADIAGMWATYDDDGKATGFVRITRHGNEYTGITTGGLPGDDPNKICTACKGDLAGHKMLGLPIIAGVTQHGDEFSGGHILDPFSGKDYDVVLKPSTDGKTLTVRGFLGIRLLGRTQVWKQAE